jgi:hypothetical protein
MTVKKAKSMLAEKKFPKVPCCTLQRGFHDVEKDDRRRATHSHGRENGPVARSQSPFSTGGQNTIMERPKNNFRIFFPHPALSQRERGNAGMLFLGRS